jgi:predicted peroxiredoxin
LLFLFLKIMKKSKATTNHTQNYALCMLAAGIPVAQVASTLGIARSTIYTWENDPKFEKKLNRAVERIYQAALSELVCNASKATQELVRIIESEDVPERVKISAISTLLTHIRHAREAHMLDVAADLEETDNEITVNVNFNDDTPV